MSLTEQVWIVDDDSSIRWVMEKALTRAGVACRAFETGTDVLEALSVEEPIVVVSDIRMPGMDGIELLSQIRAQQPDLPVIITTAHSDLDSAVNAYEEGAFEYLPKPFDIEEMVSTVTRAQSQRSQRSLPAQDQGEKKTTEIIGNAPAMQEVFRAIGRLAQSHITVLINGESGTGKELVARALHRHSPRAMQPFVALNMAAIPQELMESELFGHERGAFTGAHARRAGRFEEASGGTLFLDEIGDMPLPLQTRLLRVLAEGDYYRVGGRDLLSANVRVIAATHQDLEAKIAAGSFREDLYHRLNVINIALPPLRERQEDIPALASHFLQAAALEMGLEVKRFRPETIDRLQQMSWPGNIRQLQNLCQQLCVMAPGEQIFIEDLPPDTFSQAGSESMDGWPEHLRHWMRQSLRSGRPDLMAAAREQLERVALNCALEYTNGKRIEAARLLGLGRNTLTRKLKELEGVEVDGV